MKNKMNGKDLDTAQNIVKTKPKQNPDSQSINYCDFINPLAIDQITDAKGDDVSEKRNHMRFQIKTCAIDFCVVEFYVNNSIHTVYLSKTLTIIISSMNGLC